MRKLLLLAWLLLAAPALTAPAPVVVAGEFSNMRYTEEHAYGYTVQLWRQGDTLFGLFLCSEGLAGDTPTGRLDQAQFDPATGKLSFRAKLTTGLVYLGPGREAPSRDLFEFRGLLEKTALAGTLQRSNLLQPKAAPQVERIRLRKVTGEGMTRPASYAEWKTWADGILKFRGPKW
jgi:hypothetical protein